MKAAHMHHRIGIPLAVLALAAQALAIETPFTPFKDGYANASQYNGTGKTMIVRAADSKGWVAHALGDGAGAGVTKARLMVYVKDVIKDGTLRVSLATSLNLLETQTRFENLKAGDSVGAVRLAAAKDIQTMAAIPLSAAAVKKIQDGSFAGFILDGAEGLDAELGALEGAHGALLFLDYGAGPGKGDSVSVDSVAAVLASKYAATLKGATGSAGAKGDKGDAGAKGADGAAGAKGDKGDTGAKGDPADQAPIFKLL